MSSAGRGVLVASNAPQATLLHHLNGEAVTDVQTLNEEERELLAGMVFEPADFDYLAQKLHLPQFFVATDNNLYLEYATPKGNALGDEAFMRNVEMLYTLQQERLAAAP